MIHDQEAREVPVVCLACEWSWCIIQRDAELKKEGEVEPKP